MKRRLLSFIIVLNFYLPSLAQKAGSATLYAYKQEVIQGKALGIVDEPATKDTMVKTPFNYFIYLVSPSSLTPCEVWINGTVFSVTALPVTTTPVIQETISGAKGKVLVPATTRRVLQLFISDKEVSAPCKKGKSLSQKNELVIIYMLRGKSYYAKLDKVPEIEAAVMQ
jgi:hypothetical protein